MWTDTRAASIVRELKAKKGADELMDLCGLPLSTYPSSTKLLWMLRNVDAVKKAYENGTLAFGTVDTWLVYKLNGGPEANVFVSDPTNASRTMWMSRSTIPPHLIPADTHRYPQAQIRRQIDLILRPRHQEDPSPRNHTFLPLHKIRQAHLRPPQGYQDHRLLRRPVRRPCWPMRLHARPGQKHVRNRLFPPVQRRRKARDIHPRPPRYRRLRFQ